MKRDFSLENILKYAELISAALIFFTYFTITFIPYFFDTEWVQSIKKSSDLNIFTVAMLFIIVIHIERRLKNKDAEKSIYCFRKNQDEAIAKAFKEAGKVKDIKICGHSTTSFYTIASSRLVGNEKITILVGNYNSDCFLRYSGKDSSEKETIKTCCRNWKNKFPNSTIHLYDHDPCFSFMILNNKIAVFQLYKPTKTWHWGHVKGKTFLLLNKGNSTSDFLEDILQWFEGVTDKETGITTLFSVTNAMPSTNQQ